jgi:hypothetical protein
MCVRSSRTWSRDVVECVPSASPHREHLADATPERAPAAQPLRSHHLVVVLLEAASGSLPGRGDLIPFCPACANASSLTTLPHADSCLILTRLALAGASRITRLHHIPYAS